MDIPKFGDGYHDGYALRSMVGSGVLAPRCICSILFEMHVSTYFEMLKLK
jgi:hypothetical protein